MNIGGCWMNLGSLLMKDSFHNLDLYSAPCGAGEVKWGASSVGFTHGY